MLPFAGSTSIEGSPMLPWSAPAGNGSAMGAVNTNFDATNGDVKFASWNRAAWSIETVETAGTVGQYCSLAFDPRSGTPCVAYYDSTNAALKFAVRGVAGWNVETVASPRVAQFCSLAFEGPFGPHISFFDAMNGDLMFASKSGGVWTVETADPSYGVGRHTSLKINSFRIARIAYYDSTNGDLKLAAKDLRQSSSPWNVETVAAAGDVGRYATLAIDPQGDRFQRGCGKQPLGRCHRRKRLRRPGRTQRGRPPGQ